MTRNDELDGKSLIAPGKKWSANDDNFFQALKKTVAWNQLIVAEGIGNRLLDNWRCSVIMIDGSSEDPQFDMNE